MGGDGDLCAVCVQLVGELDEGQVGRLTPGPRDLRVLHVGALDEPDRHPALRKRLGIRPAALEVRLDRCRHRAALAGHSRDSRQDAVGAALLLCAHLDASARWKRRGDPLETPLHGLPGLVEADVREIDRQERVLGSSLERLREGDVVVGDTVRLDRDRRRSHRRSRSSSRAPPRRADARRQAHPPAASRRRGPGPAGRRPALRRGGRAPRAPIPRSSRARTGRAERLRERTPGG